MTTICAPTSSRAECSHCDIRHIALFSDLTAGDLASMHLPVTKSTLAIGDLIYLSEGEGRHVFTLRKGVVKLVQYLPDGSQRIVRLLGPGTALGLEALLDRPYEHDAIVLQDAELCRIPVEEIHRLCVETPRLYRQLMSRWHESIRLADEWLTNMSTGSARTRLARLFLYLTDNGRNSHCGLFRREDLGAMLGISTETASRMVADFRRSGAISQIRRNYYQCDPLALATIADEAAA